MKRTKRITIHRRRWRQIDEIDRVKLAQQKIIENQTEIREMQDSVREVLRQIQDLSLNEDFVNLTTRYINHEMLHNSRDWRAVEAMRRAKTYAEPFTSDRPLVTIIVPSSGDRDSLAALALPSILNQTYPNLEIIVSLHSRQRGDSTLASRVASCLPTDSRVQILLPAVTTAPRIGSAECAEWHNGGFEQRRHALSQARGAWFMFLDDDDSLMPTAVESLLKHAQTHHEEWVYGTINMYHRDGTHRVINEEFPPRLSFNSINGAIYHHGLSPFWDDTGNQVLDLPGDAYRLLRMANAGTLIGHIPTHVQDYFPSHEWDASAD